MDTILQVNDLCKAYPRFQLEHVGFSVEKGTIMGLIGRNGAGKTTTLKAILNFVHPSSGDIRFFGLPFSGHEGEIKQRIGYASGTINYYPRKKLCDITRVTKRFYSNWDDTLYRRYMERFSLEEDKKPNELSEGMKVKYNLVLALSHHAECLILDEPTSGLDPVSRDELLEIFLGLAQDGVAILFSTHIITDLEKCADSITYLHAGRVLASKSCKAFTEDYLLIQHADRVAEPQRALFCGVCQSKAGSTALIHAADAASFDNSLLTKPDMQTIMVHLEKEAF